jgi:hypothetical protein
MPRHRLARSSSTGRTFRPVEDDRAKQSPASYWTATRHPWACVLFVLPLLALYEIGLHGLGSSPEDLRNGAEVWLRGAVRAAGLSPLYGAPCVVLALLLLWSLQRRHDRPTDQIGVWAGMAAESALFALALFGASQALGHGFTSLQRHLTPEAARLLTWWSAAPRTPEPALQQIVRFLGAGIYEETLFRLLLFSALLALFALADFPPLLKIGLAAVGSALLFAAAHHLGPAGDAWDGYVFAYRTLAGLYFAWLFHVRGFGIAVGAHAGYDVLVGLLAPLAG